MRPVNTRKSVTVFVLALLMLLSSAASSSANSPNEQALTSDQDINFELFTVEDGLLNNATTAVYQDSQGFMWVGTEIGLNRYDGYEFTAYTHNPAEPTSLSGNNIWIIRQDSRETLWVGAWGNGLNKYNPDSDSFTRYTHDEENPNSISSDLVWSFLEDSNGFIWLGTEGGGLNKFDPVTETFVHYQYDRTNPDGIGGDDVSFISEDSEGSLWVGGLRRRFG